jgi:predicted ATPase
MIQLVEALNFRCLRYVRQTLGPFHVLVGPNASGKTSFLDVPAFLAKLVAEGVEAAVAARTQNFHDFVWGREVPAWALSDGTLHLMALTILAYAPNVRGVWLVEEPETALHPLNIEPILQSLQSLYDGQVLLATQSPAVLAAIEAKDVLVFSHGEASGTRIVKGSERPDLTNWHGLPNLSVLFSSGVLS